MATTIAELLASDPRIADAKRLIREAVADHGKRIVGVSPPHPDLEIPYRALVDEFGQIRGGPLFFPYLGSGIGRGCLVELADGSVKYDFISGIGVHHWGRSHPELVGACIGAALDGTVWQGNLQQNVDSVHLAKTLLTGANRTGASLRHCFLSTSGATANENALKIVFQKMFPADRVLAFEGCFMGRTLALSQVTDKAAYREGLPPTIAVDYVPYFDPSRPNESLEESLDRLKRYLARYPSRHAAMVFELVQGEGGFNPGSREFFIPLMALLRSHGIPIIVDEVQTFGRTTELFAFQHFGLEDFVDVVTFGKAAQVCATLFREEFKPRPGLLSQTFTASTAAIAASQVIVRGLMEGGYLGPDGTIARLHDHFRRKLTEMEQHHPDLLCGPYGLGAMIACTPLGGDEAKVKQFVQALFKSGVITFHAGTNPCRVRFLIPVGAVTFEDIDAVASIFEDTLINMPV